MHDPRETQTRWSPSNYVESGVEAERVFVPHNHVRVVGTGERAEIIGETYRLLAIAVFSAMAACWATTHYKPLLMLVASPVGWMLSFLGLNIIPGLALSAARRSSRNAAMLLLGHGAFSGVVLSPLVYLALLKSGQGIDTPNLVQAALIVTATVFLGISGYVYQSGQQFSAFKGFGVGLAWSLLVAIPLNAFMLHSGTMGLVLTVGIGLLGTLQLLWATSTVLRDPEFRDPAYGALALFAGLFNFFQAVLSLLNRR